MQKHALKASTISGVDEIPPHRQWDVQSAELLGLFLEGKDPQLAFLPAAWCRCPVPLEEALPSLVWVIVYRPPPTPTCRLGWRYLARGEFKNKKSKVWVIISVVQAEHIQCVSKNWILILCNQIQHCCVSCFTKKITRDYILKLSTWGWAGDGASGCWASSWFCSALWGTIGLLPVDMTPILWPDGLCWDRAAFSRYRTTVKKLHKYVCCSRDLKNKNFSVSFIQFCYQTSVTWGQDRD